MAFVESIEFCGLNRKAVNFELHSEVFLKSRNVRDLTLDYASFEFAVKLKSTKNYPVLVRAIDGTLQFSNRVFRLERYDFCFTRVALRDDTCMFSVVLIVSPEEKDAVSSFINGQGKEIFSYLNLELVSDKFVSTVITCKNVLKRVGECAYSSDANDKKSALSFWRSNSIIARNEIIFRHEKNPKRNSP